MSAARTPMKDLPHSQQAGILSNDPKFQNFVAACQILPTRMATESEAAEYIRRHCGVRTRRDLDRLEHARTRFAALVTEFDAWRGKIPRQR